MQRSGKWLQVHTISSDHLRPFCTIGVFCAYRACDIWILHKSNVVKLNYIWNLNPLNTELIWLHSSRRNPTFLRKDIVLFGSPITPVNVVRNLEVILDENMTMSEHIARVCRNCYYQLPQIRSITAAAIHGGIYLMSVVSRRTRMGETGTKTWRGRERSATGAPRPLVLYSY